MTCTKVATNGKPYERVLKVDAKNLTIQVCGGKGGATGLLLDDVEDLRGGLASSEFEKFHAELSSKVSLMPDLSERALVLKTSNRTFSFLLKSAGCRTNVSHCVLYLLKSKKRGVMAPGRAPGHAEDHRTPKDGHGTATYNRSTYTGQFRNRKRHGHGVLTLSDGTRYESEWRDDVRHGKGKEHCLDGTTFEGEYVNGMREGPGVMTWPEGSKYRGQFREGRANGNGELLRTDGSIYTGQFYEDCMQGEGCMQWKDGVRYEGQFQCNLREGRGLMLWVSGKWKSYDGKWKEGCQHGSGVLTDHNGREFRGVFKQGKLERWVDS
ncbi:unnamed protein product [Prorocentrum cordatum]|uniref:Uncharacterized protein n=1 Tax=Prorocentrum cordatum TaxID=2364126 RepID=A0ABN9PMR1_9DINO|nr:unnamed protein product [Polarella glacialis]